jgi:hypothetical protein
MMIKEFKHLSAEEVNLLYQAPVLVTILIAGADNTIDNAEIKEARELTRIKKTKDNEVLNDYYKVIGDSFEEEIKKHIQLLPKDTDERNMRIVERLSNLNFILPKLNIKFAVNFYTHLKDLAKKIAEASGGVLGYMAVGKEESEFISLDMIKDPSKPKGL